MAVYFVFGIRFVVVVVVFLLFSVRFYSAAMVFVFRCFRCVGLPFVTPFHPSFSFGAYFHPLAIRCCRYAASVLCYCCRSLSFSLHGTTAEAAHICRTENLSKSFKYLFVFENVPSTSKHSFSVVCHGFFFARALLVLSVSPAVRACYPSYDVGSAVLVCSSAL